MTNKVHTYKILQYNPATGCSIKYESGATN